MLVRIWMGLFSLAMVGYRLLNSLGVDRVSDSSIKRAKREARRAYARVKARLGALNFDRGIATVAHFEKRHDELLELLSEKFSPADLGSDRYRAMSESVRAGLVVTLTHQCDILEDSTRDATAKETAIAALASASDEALATLDLACLDLKHMNVEKPESWSEVEASLSKLEELVGKAHLMSAKAYAAAVPQAEGFR